MTAGLVPTDFANKSSESALSVYPIGNCQENWSVTTVCAMMNNFKVFQTTQGILRFWI